MAQMKQIRIKNYSTSVPATRSIGQIEEMLVAMGAEQIMKDYAGETIKAIAFRLNIEGEYRGFKLPTETDKMIGLAKKYRREWKMPRDDLKLREQCERIVWRVTRDWLHAQISVIQIGQATPDQVLLPYMWDGKRTIYEALQERNFNLQLESPK